MTINQIRQKYIDFFKEKSHAVIPSASLIPENDPSVLFTMAGMHPLVPFLMGESHPAGKRLVGAQKCIRTGDIDEVGDDSHLTFFEMMGNWSLGDYWKEEAINWSYEFLTDKKWLGLNPDKLAIAVFGGDEDCAFDEESYRLWRSLGISESRIIKLGKDDNWWPAGGKSIGPQGPDTEIFYWTGEAEAPTEFNHDDGRWLEIWNNVFMEYERTKEGKYLPLKQKNVDTGLGLERLAMVMQNKKSFYEIESFVPMMAKIKSLAQNYDERSARIIVDHIKAAAFIMADNANIVPSNLDQGYVARKLIRLAIRHAKKIGIPIELDTSASLVEIIVKEYQDVYPELGKNHQRLVTEMKKEEGGFEKTLERGLKEFNKMSLDKEISGFEAFDLYSTYGFPLEMTKELAKEARVKVDEEGFNQEMAKHQELSKTSSAGKFKGGLVNHSEEVVKYHTATHLLHQALRDVLGNHVEQRGSNITEKRLRFDFSHPDKMTDEEKKKVADIINQKIKEDLPVTFKEMSVDEAKAEGAIGLFGDKYGEKVKVYSVGNYSKEICGGPHVEHLGELGHFKIKKEEASSAGIRRIKAVLE
jgi:alanyl-tRNA synthetase